MNRDRNMLKPDCEVVCFYNINCSSTVLIYGILEHWRLVIQGFLVWVGSIGPFLWPSLKCGPHSLLNGMKRMVGFWLTNERKRKKDRG